MEMTMLNTRFRFMDYHLHTSRCLHAAGSMPEYVEAAIRMGIESIGFADHAPTTSGFDPGHRMTWQEFEGYIKEIEEIRKLFPEIEIFTGIEADIYPGFETDLVYLRDRFPVDYVIGSVHYVSGQLIFHAVQETRSPEIMQSLLNEYFMTLKQGTESNLIDIAGHLDVVKYLSSGTVTEQLRKAMISIFQLLAEKQIIVELNTSGLRKLPEQTFPDPEFWPILAGYGIQVCLGSDAHQPGQVGHGFEAASDLLLKTDFRQQSRSASGLLVLSVS